MRRFLIRRPSASMVVALLALVFATAGTAVAATKLVSGDKLIKKHSLSGNRLRNHTLTGKQINLAKLGKVPSALSADHAGEAGHATSADGLTVLPSGQSESGIFSAGGANPSWSSSPPSYIGYGLTYPRPLASPIPNNHIIDVQSGTATHCSGFGHADPGYLCLYDTVVNDVDGGYGYSNSPSELQQSPSIGVILYWRTSGVDSYVGGEWTVTAP